MTFVTIKFLNDVLGALAVRAILPKRVRFVYLQIVNRIYHGYCEI